MELTVVGTVQLVIFYEAEGEHGKAVLAAAPLIPGVLRKGKELLPKKGTNLADDVAKRVAPNKGVTRTFTQLVDDIVANPSKWKAISAHTEKATRKGARRYRSVGFMGTSDF